MAASLLLRLAKEPVNLEPQPVPMLLLHTDSSSSEGVQQTAQHHGLVPQPYSDAVLQQWICARY